MSLISSFGSRTLSPFYSFQTVSPFVASFTKSLSALSFQAGDFGGDSDTITIAVYSGLNGTGTLLGTNSVVYGLGTLPNDITTLSISGVGAFQSAVFSGGSALYPNSMFYDNFTATVSDISMVPLPSSAPMFGAALLGLAGVGCAAKRKKAAVAA